MKIDIVYMGDSISYCKSCYGKLKLSFPVEQVRLNGDSVCVYGSIRDASDATGIPYSQIYACVMGKTRRCHGFIWRKADVVGE